MRPIIGITTSFRKNEHCLSADYSGSIERAGGVPVIVPVFTSKQSVSLFLDTANGLIISGGPAVVDGLIGALPDDIEETETHRLRNDRWLIEEAMERDIPVLGICYGMQLINAIAGGTIYADVQKQMNLSAPHSEQRGAGQHELIVAENTNLSRIVGRPAVSVNTHHIQALASVGKGLSVCATSSDGVIEAVESKDGRILGVQFHPEKPGGGLPCLFDHLVREAMKNR